MKRLCGNDKNIRNILLGLNCSPSSPGLSPAVELEMVFRESCGAWLLSAVCSCSLACTVGEVSGTRLCSLYYLFMDLLSRNLSNPSLTLLTLSASAASYVSRFHEFNVPVQRSTHFLSAYPPPPWLCKPQSGPPLQTRVPASFISPPEAAAPSSWPFTCLSLSFPLLHYPCLEMQF